MRLIVNFLEPTKGSIIDPACGSGGMFVSSGELLGVKLQDHLVIGSPTSNGGIGYVSLRESGLLEFK